MAERAVNNRRKSVLILNNISPVTNTFDELVKEKLEAGKFPITKTGLIKMVGIVVLSFGLALFLAQPTCQNTSSWYPYLYPISLGDSVLVQFVLFIIFSFGWTVKKPWIWIRIDIFLNLILSIITIISSTLTNIDCTNADSSINKLPGPIGIAGGVILIISCAAIFLMYRYNDEGDDFQQTESPETTGNLSDHRKSVFA